MRELIFNFVLAKQVSKYVTVGAIGTLINLVVLYVLVEFFGLYYIIGAVIGYMLGITSNFYWNKKWTFHNHSNHYEEQYEKYVVVSLVCGVLSLALLFLFVEMFNIWYILGQFIAIVSGGVLGFILNKMWSFDGKS
ncbi:GtrA family protein [Candidatus Woesearchaeota archaeon]|nr:GtrA family protein [Candidatus Woesearchaeota archaeon]